MAQVKAGDTVKVHYTCKLEDGTVFYTSIDRAPWQFTIGEGEVIPQAVVGMNPGESKTITVPADKAYNPHYQEIVLKTQQDEPFPPYLKPEVGDRLQIHRKVGQTIVATVTDASESSVKLHIDDPLAGKDLTFDIQLIEII